MPRKLTTLADAIGLAAHAPGNSDYLALYDAAAAVAKARSLDEITEAEEREMLAKIEARIRIATALSAIEFDELLRRRKAARDALTAAEAVQALTETARGIGQ